MGFLDKAKDKLGDLVDDKGEQIGDGLDKAADFIDDKTGGKYSDKIDGGVDKVKDALDGLDGDEDIPDGDRAEAQAPSERTQPTPSEDSGDVPSGRSMGKP